MNALEKNINRALSLAGLLMTSLSMSSYIYFYGPMLVADLDHRLGFISAEPTQVVLAQEEFFFTTNGSFAVVIPTLGVSSEIIANVDPSNEIEYNEALKHGVAHAKGTYLPNQGGTVYLFAENNKVFYLLKNLGEGEIIELYYKALKYEYKVTEKLVVPATDTSWLTESSSERVIFQTCDPPGTSWKRLLVIADRV